MQALYGHIASLPAVPNPLLYLQLQNACTSLGAHPCDYKSWPRYTIAGQ